MALNGRLAELFEEMADLLELQGVEWKPNAYRKAARVIETLEEPVEDIGRRGLKALTELPNIGEGIANKILEFLKTGRLKEFEVLSKSVPKGVEEMLHVQGLGPKKVMRLYRELNIKSVKELKKAAEEGRLRKLSGFGEKSEQDIVKGLSLLEQGKERKLLSLGLSWSREIASRLKKVQGVKRAEPAGSVRRMKETIGDVDVLVISKDPKKVMETFTKMPEVERVLAKGDTRSSVILNDGLQADVRVLDEKSFGAALQYFTGSKEHNVRLRQIAIRKGFKLSEYGLFRNDKYVCGKTEEEVYRKLGLNWIPPELRENQGEFEKNIPRLVSMADMQGDLHMHSKWSDGWNTIEEMALTAQKAGYKYIALTDHSKSERIANGLDEKRLVKYLKEIDKVQKKVDITILKGSEVDILKDGSLDFKNKYLKELDFVLGAVHSGFKSPKADMTKRILKAFDNPYINALAHPTGRVVHQREGYAFDAEKIMSAAKERGIALEVDSYPSRLDMRDELVQKAVDMGCKISIDTDSHSVEHLRYMELGVAQARRGWAQAKDVINALSLKKLQTFLKR
ncbi:DNA polymerase/3'-5' exonuclease PolX [Candidatus Woesearchaeota archaeon]|nr:DNA polymerase/3'-5' exonuclease PolX [Candidatus Woesearchaeota archaeon]